VPESDAQRRFMQAMSEWLVALPHDLKLLYEAASDPNLDREARELAVGAIISTISPGHLPGVPRGDFINYCDGVILLRLVAQRIVARGDEDCDAFKERFSDFYEKIDDDVALCESVLGDIQWLRDKTAALHKLEYKSKKVGVYLDDDDASEFLYEDGLEFQTEYEVDDDVLSDRLKRVSTILDALQKRRKADTRA
jgi:hypothetical protein